MTVNIVSRFFGVGGGEIYSRTLAGLLAARCETTLWSDADGPEARRYGAVPIRPFSGEFPRDGTLILVGTYSNLHPWISHCRARRVIVVCNLSFPAQTFGFLTQLQQAGLPAAELVFVSDRLRRTLELDGRLCPSLTPIERFRCPQRSAGSNMTIGRLSRDTLEKHHPDDPALYRLLDQAGIQVRIMGGTCLAPAFREPGPEGITLLPVGRETPEAFLQSLDVFFYRTNPAWNEPSGGVVMEAMASGLPVVAHIAGGYTDWIRSGDNGFLFSTQEEAVRYLHRLRNDPELRAGMGQSAEATAKKIDGPEAIEEYCNWLLKNEAVTAS